MTALKVIGIILLIFILIGFLRVGALMQFGDELRVQLSVGPFRFTLLPAKEKKETPKKKGKGEEAKVRGRRGEAKEKALAPQADKRGAQEPHHDGALGAQGDSETHLQAPSHRPAGNSRRLRRHGPRGYRADLRLCERRDVGCDAAP